MKIHHWLICITIFIASCSGEEQHDITDQVIQTPAKITSPLNEAQYEIGAVVDVSIEIKDPSKVSNLELYVNDTLYATGLEVKSQTISIETENSKVGFITVRLQYIDGESKNRSDSRELVFFSDITPELKVAKIITTYSHSKSSYTQGLEFYKGKFYESTGREGESFIAEVDLYSGTIIRQKDLDKAVFGEGITVLKDKIYQLSYRKGTCLVYDMEFNIINEFTYTGQGWGLCNDGEFIIMSNGSTEVVWRNPETFEIVKTINIFDNQTSVDSINELELINGNLFANIYTDSRIVEIDTATGKVLTYIDCNSLVADGKVPGADVLNGIAMNTENGKIYMTGKWWPKLYEVIFE